MANNYCQTSSVLSIPKAKVIKAAELTEQFFENFSDPEYGYDEPDFQYELRGEDEDDPHFWFYSDESFNPDHLEKFVSFLLEQLELDTPFQCSWAYTCSKPRVDEFGGGGFLVRRGLPTEWVDSQAYFNQFLEKDEKQSIDG